MNWVRAKGGGGKGQTSSFEEEGTDHGKDHGKSEGIANLEREGTWRTLCNLEPAITPIRNSFQILASGDEEDIDEDHARAGCRHASCGHHDHVPVQHLETDTAWTKVSGKKGRKRIYRRMSPMSAEVNSLEVNAVNGKGIDGEELWLTIDSGSAENVISKRQASHVPIRPSQGSIAGVQYATADGTTMYNYGEKAIKVLTEEGSRCTLKMQVTDVTKPLMSVSKICDAGHEVVFNKSGGVIKSIETGQETRFIRVNNVYRLRVTAPFGGQGR